jgi:hypothetical protein
MLIKTNGFEFEGGRGGLFVRVGGVEMDVTFQGLSQGKRYFDWMRDDSLHLWAGHCHAIISRKVA